MPFNIGPVELILVLAIALMVFGPGKLPEVGKGLGSSIREFRKAATDMQESVKLEASVTSPATPAGPAAPSAARAVPEDAAHPVV